jgi:hypothetical protein
MKEIRWTERQIKVGALVFAIIAASMLYSAHWRTEHPRQFTEAENAAYRAGQTSDGFRQQGWKAGYSLGKQTAVEGGAIPQDWALRQAASTNAEKARVGAGEPDYISGYVAGYEAAYKQFTKPAF